MSKFSRELRAVVHPRKASDLIAAGTSKHVLAGPRWSRVTRGYYLPAVAATLDPTPTQRIVSAGASLPAGAVIGGWAAAYALGVDLLDGRDDHTMRLTPVPVCLPRACHLTSVEGVRYVRTNPGTEDVRVVGGLRFTGPLRTALDLACWAPSVVEAVVAIDAMLQARVVTPAQLSSGRLQLTGRPGARQARQAIALGRLGVRSTWESRLRMAYVLDLGYEMPLINSPVFDLEQRFLGVPDLLDVEAGLALEFDGARWTGLGPAAGHRDRDQHREDNAREEGFERAGLIVVRVDSGDLTRHRRRLLLRLRAARNDGLTRDRHRDRWTLQPPPSWVGLPA